MGVSVNISVWFPSWQQGEQAGLVGVLTSSFGFCTGSPRSGSGPTTAGSAPFQLFISAEHAHVLASWPSSEHEEPCAHE